jgi:hypothetical protein
VTSSDTAPHTILDALAHGVTGKTDEGLALIQPLIDAGSPSTFALLCCLAESIAGPDRDAHPGYIYVFAIEPEDTGPRPSGDLPPALSFGSWADTMGTGDLTDAIRAVFDIAVMSCRDVIAARHAERAPGAGQ